MLKKDKEPLPKAAKPETKVTDDHDCYLEHQTPNGVVAKTLNQACRDNHYIEAQESGTTQSIDSTAIKHAVEVKEEIKAKAKVESKVDKEEKVEE